MLRKIKYTNDNSDWFNDSDEDLFIYYQPNGEVRRIDYCYNKTANEHVIIFKHNKKHQHMAVDSGEANSNMKMSPIYVANGVYHLPDIVIRLSDAIAHLPQATQTTVLDFVRQHVD